MTIKVRYFAALRDQRGVGEETIDCNCESVGQLYHDLASAYKFSLSPAQIRYALNGEYVPGETTLSEGDEVVFIPPVAGG